MLPISFVWNGEDASNSFTTVGHRLVHEYLAHPRVFPAGGYVVFGDWFHPGVFLGAAFYGVVAAGVEGAAGGHAGGVGDVAGDLGEFASFSAGVEAGDGAEKAEGVGVFGVAVEVFGGCHLADLAGVHDADAVGVSGDDSEVVGDHEEGGAELLGEVLHQFQDLGLDGDVERGCSFVGDEETRVAAEGDGDHDALSLSTTEHVGVVSDARRRIGNADHVEQFLGAGRGLSAGHAEVLLERLDDLSSDG